MGSRESGINRSRVGGIDIGKEGRIEAGKDLGREGGREGSREERIEGGREGSREERKDRGREEGSREEGSRQGRLEAGKDRGVEGGKTKPVTTVIRESPRNNNNNMLFNLIVYIVHSVLCLDQEDHKVHIFIEYHSVCPLVGIGTLPPPLSSASAPLPPEPKGGRHTRLRVRGWGSPNSDDWRKSLALCLLCEEDLDLAIFQSYRDNPKINAIVLVKGRLEDWPQLPPVPVEPEEDDLTEEHKVPYRVPL